MNTSVIISCLIIFFLRIIDTILQTLTTIFMSQGNKKAAPFFGFLQTISYIIALNLVIKKLDNPLNLAAYAIAYSVGVFFGITLEEKIAYGHVLIQAVIDEKNDFIIDELRKMNFIVTVTKGKGREDIQRYLLFIATKRKRAKEVKEYLRKNKVFMTISKSDMFSNV